MRTKHVVVFLYDEKWKQDFSMSERSGLEIMFGLAEITEDDRHYYFKDRKFDVDDYNL